MDDSHLPITRCPHCKSAFRVRESQLTQRRGMVRCGGCRSVFNAIQQMLHQRGNTITIVPPSDLSLPPGYDAPQELNPLTLMPERVATSVENAPPPITTNAAEIDSQESAQANGESEISTSLEINSDAALETAENSSLATGQTLADLSPALINIPPPTPTPTPKKTYVEPNHEISTDELEAALAGKPKPMDAVDRFDWKPSRPKRPAWIGVTWTLAALALAFALAAQLLFGYRNDIVARMPHTRLFFTQLCEPLGCTIAPPERPSSLLIDGAEFQADPAHTGLYIFSATIRNRHEHGAAYPSLIITLTGLNNAVLSRRIFAPAEYAPGSADLKNGLAGNSEIEFKLWLDASTINPIGFDVRTTYAPGSAT